MLPQNPNLYQINTRLWLTSLSDRIGRIATLDDIPDAALDRIASQGFDWVYLLGVWQTGTAGRQISLSHAEWRKEYQAVLPDLRNDDICGSCFAVTGYSVAARFGGGAALARLRARLQGLGLRLMLDFVPNHTAPDHPWVKQHPEYYVQGSRADLEREPETYTMVNTNAGILALAHGRDPYFPGWPDTLQLNFASQELQAKLIRVLVHMASVCDGLRCDMAMLVLPKIFHRTWGLEMQDFWPRAITAVRQANPGFVFMAEVYWGLEKDLLEQGFDFAYDKRLYDCLLSQDSALVIEHLKTTTSFQASLARFLENHDEARSAAAFPWPVHQAAGIITYLSPGLRFFHQGQLQGFRRKVPVHLCQGPEEQGEAAIENYYRSLLACLTLPAVKTGKWRLLAPSGSGQEVETWQNLIGFYWQADHHPSVLAVINYSGHPGQGHLVIPVQDLARKQIHLVDQMHPIHLYFDRDQLNSPGLNLNMPAWGYHIFVLETSD